jgi:hypothetical protein
VDLDECCMHCMRVANTHTSARRPSNEDSMGHGLDVSCGSQTSRNQLNVVGRTARIHSFGGLMPFKGTNEHTKVLNQGTLLILHL